MVAAVGELKSGMISLQQEAALLVTHKSMIQK